ncbi:MAG TPA: tetratricopeptide repeat protein [Pseudobdellovibrionaceae bacterium]|nr:tetratricopeptide repeat protein [Pseudobdellovibrionaceae bacterium]
MFKQLKQIKTIYILLFSCVCSISQATESEKPQMCGPALHTNSQTSPDHGLKNDKLSAIYKRLKMARDFNAERLYVQSEALARAILLDAPESLDAKVTLLHSLFRQGKYAEATNNAEVIIAQMPTHRIAWGILAASLLSLKRHQEALAAINEKLSLDQSDRVGLETKAEILIGLNRFPEAIGLLKTSIRLYPDSAGKAERLLYKANNLWKSQHTNGVHPGLSKVEMESLLNQGRLFQERGQYHELNQIADQLLKHYPDHIAAVRMKAIATHKLGIPTEALQYAKRALHADPGFKTAHGIIAGSLITLDKNAEALAFLNTHLKNNPEDNISYGLKFKALVNLGQFDEARIILKLLYRLEGNKNKKKLDDLASQLDIQSGSTSRGLEFVVSLLRKNPQDPVAKRRIIQANLAAVFHEKSIRAQYVAPAYEDGLPKFARPALKAQLLYEQGRIDDAQLLLNQVLEIDPHNIFAMKLKFNLDWKLQNYEDAIEAAQKTLVHEPHYKPAIGVIVNSLLRLKRTKEARQVALNELPFDPDDQFLKRIAASKK